jgi:hypothetical protein
MLKKSPGRATAWGEWHGMTATLFFLAGFLVGSVSTLLVVGLCMAAKRGDD